MKRNCENGKRKDSSRPKLKAHDVKEYVNSEMKKKKRKKNYTNQNLFLSIIVPDPLHFRWSNE